MMIASATKTNIFFGNEVASQAGLNALSGRMWPAGGNLRTLAVHHNIRSFDIITKVDRRNKSFPLYV